MSVKDVIKKSILESDVFNQAITTSTIFTIVVDMLVAVLFGFIIYRIYKKHSKSVVYNRSFAFTLWGMTILTSAVTLAISTNIVISLGMVGALSIVRFRTAVKEPYDLLYLFWSISAGIIIGASMYILLIVVTLVMAGVIFLFDHGTSKNKSYIMVIAYHGEDTADEILRQLGRSEYTVRSKVFRGEQAELTLQLVVRSGNLSVGDRIKELTNVDSVTILEFDGEYHG